MMDVYVYGSGECDQLGLPDFDEGESKIPRKLALNTEPSNKVYKIACGGMHTLVLSTFGKVYSWGCNDDGALGRQGADNQPMLIDAITFPINNIAAGDSHSVAYNTDLNLIYRWGAYRDNAGKLGDPISSPELMNKKSFDNLKIVKAVCGANHSLVLAGKTLFAWGNKESGQTGLNPISKLKFNHLTPHQFSTKNVVDVFTALNHSFLVCLVGKDKNKVLKGWGLNKHCQLGIEDTNNHHNPTELTWFTDENVKVKYATGGDFHSVFLSDSNEVYVCGRNDEGQCGVEDKDKKIKESEENNEECEIRDDVTNPGMILENDIKEQNGVNHDANEDKENNEDREEENCEFVRVPTKLNFFDTASRPVHNIISSMNFNYALDTSNNQVYSWGLGYSYVLGNKQENNERFPYSLPKSFFMNLNVDQISLGSQHVAVALFDPAQNLPKPTLEFDLEHYREELRKQVEEKKTKTGKRKATESVRDAIEEEKLALDKNAPRSLRTRVQPEKKSEEKVTILKSEKKRGRSTDNSKDQEKKSKSKSKSMKKENKVDEVIDKKNTKQVKHAKEAKKSKSKSKAK